MGFNYYEFNLNTNIDESKDYFVWFLNGFSIPYSFLYYTYSIVNNNYTRNEIKTSFGTSV